MIIRSLLLNIVTCLSYLLSPVEPHGKLTIQPMSVDTTYCVPLKGKGVLARLRLTIKYVNNSDSPILVPLFARVSGYTLFAGNVSFDPNRVEDRMTYPSRTVLDTKKLDSSHPAEDRFSLIRPGGEHVRVYYLSIPVNPPRRKSLWRNGADHYLTVDLDHWPGEPKPAERLQSAWKAEGLLWTTKTSSEPIKVHLERDPQTSPCPLRVD